MKEKDLRRILSANIKRFRNRRAWSQAKLAEKIDLSTNFLSDIETGKGWVSPLTLVKLAKALDIEVYELFKPEEALPADVKGIITQYTRDIAATITDSLDKVKNQYLS
jgi:transcriptional regulator with XRE-family HTH domain